MAVQGEVLRTLARQPNSLAVSAAGSAQLRAGFHSGWCSFARGPGRWSCFRSIMAAKQAQSGGVTQARSSAGCAHVLFLSRSCSACTHLAPSRPLQPIDEVAEYRVRLTLVHTLFAVPTNFTSCLTGGARTQLAVSVECGAQGAPSQRSYFCRGGTQRLTSVCTAAHHLQELAATQRVARGELDLDIHQVRTGARAWLALSSDAISQFCVHRNAQAEAKRRRQRLQQVLAQQRGMGHFEASRELSIVVQAAEPGRRAPPAGVHSGPFPDPPACVLITVAECQRPRSHAILLMTRSAACASERPQWCVEQCEAVVRAPMAVAAA